MSTSIIDLEPTAQSQQVARSAGIVSMAVGISRVAGLAREIIMAHFFGAGFSFDAFLLAFRIPNLTRELFAEGALSSSFIPSFAAALERDGPQQASELAKNTMEYNLALSLITSQFHTFEAVISERA